MKTECLKLPGNANLWNFFYKFDIKNTLAFQIQAQHTRLDRRIKNRIILHECYCQNWPLSESAKWSKQGVNLRRRRWKNGRKGQAMKIMSNMGLPD